jgi:hypothetical protein
LVGAGRCPAAITLLIPDAAKRWAANAAPGSMETLAVGALAMTALMVASWWSVPKPSWSSTAPASLPRPSRPRELVEAPTDAQTIQAFSAHVRDELALYTLRAELLALVEETMQPIQASVGLRPPAPPLQLTGPPYGGLQGVE